MVIGLDDMFTRREFLNNFFDGLVLLMMVGAIIVNPVFWICATIYLVFA